MYPPGFVEPVPEFYARLAILVEKTEGLLNRRGALDLDYRMMAANVRTLVARLEENGIRTKDPMDVMMAIYRGSGGEPDESDLNLVSVLSGRSSVGASAPSGADLVSKLQALADGLDKGRMPDDERVAYCLKAKQIDIAPLWRQLGEVARRLETLSHKQLRGADLNDDDSGFLRSYGIGIAGIMLYGGNSYEVSRDDAPRVIDVHANSTGTKYLEVGVGRPRALYVLYPYKGGEVLCRGGVMPYYEFAGAERLTDAAWKTLLNSKEPPQRPRG